MIFNRKLITPSVFAIVLIALFFSVSVDQAQAATCTATATGNWNTPGTWDCGHVPLSTDDVVITSAVAATITVDTAAVANSVTITNTAVASTQNVDLAVGANSLTISAGGGLTINGGGAASRNARVTITTGTLTVPGNVTFTGTTRAQFISTGASTTNVGGNFGSTGCLSGSAANCTTAVSGTINFNGGAAQTVGIYTTYNNIQINNTSGNVTLTGTTTFGGTLLVNTGTFDVGAFTLTVTGATTVNSTLMISSTTGTKTFGDLTIATGGTMSFTAAEAITENGNITIDGTGAITGTTGLWTFQKVGGGTIGGTSTATETLGSATFTTSYTSGLKLIITGTSTVTSPANLTNNSTYTATGALSGTGTFTQGSNSILNIAGASAITTLDASVNSNEVHYTSTSGAQTIHAGTYHHLFIEKSGQTGTVGTPGITVNGNLNVTAGILADGGFQITGNATGTLTLAAGTTLTLGLAAAATTFPTAFTVFSISNTSTVNYNATSAQTISNAITYGHLTLTGASVTKTAAGALTINGIFTNATSTGVFADGGFTITLKDGLVMTGVHTGTGKLLLTGGSAAHSVSASGSINNIELDDSNGATQAAVTNIGGTLTVTTGTWTSTNTLVVTGATSISSTLVISSATGTKTFGDLTINSGSAMNLTTAIETVTINGNMTIATGGSMNFSVADIIPFFGNLTINGTGAITGTTGLWTFQKVGGGTIGGTAPSITISGSTTFATQYTLPSIFTVNTLTVNTGINETNAGTTTVNTGLSGAGTFTQSSGSILNLGGTSAITALDASVNSNDVHYTSTTGNQTVKSTNYYNLFIDKAGFTGNAGAGTMNILGNFVISAGTFNGATAIINVTGTTDIFGSIADTSGNAPSADTFNGLVTVHSIGSWAITSGESCDFFFHNGLHFDGITFVPGTGIYTFDTNNQELTGTTPINISKVVVTGIQLTNNNSSSVTVPNNGTLSGTGEFIQGVNSTLNIGGSATIATLTASASGNVVSYTSSSAQTVLTSTYQTLRVDANTNGSINIVADTAANTELRLAASTLSTGSSKMIIGPSSTLTRTSGFIIGNLQKHVPTGPTSRTFEVGTGSDYTPADITFGSVSGAGEIVGTAIAGDHANISTSGFFASRTVNRNWDLTNIGVIFDNYSGTFTFVPTDLDLGVNTAHLILKKLDAGVWTKPTLGTVTATSMQGTGMTTFSGFQIGERPVSDVTSSSPDDSYGEGELISIQITFADNVFVTGTPELDLNSGGTASYVSGSGTPTLTFEYTVGPTDSSSDLDYTSTSALTLNGGTIQDVTLADLDLELPAPGAAGSLGANKNIIIDTGAPLVTSVDSDGDTYTQATSSPQTIKITFGEDISNTPTVSVSPDGGAQVVNDCGDVDAKTFCFDYTIPTDTEATETITISGAQDMTGNTMNSDSSHTFIVDTDEPAVSNVTSSLADGTYTTGQVVPIQITFTETVIVTGTPTLTISTGSPATTDIDYVSGSGTDTLTFNYTVVSGNSSPDLDYASTNSLSGTIKDSFGNDAILTLPAPGAAGSLGGNKNIVIDTSLPPPPPPPGGGGGPSGSKPTPTTPPPAPGSGCTSTSGFSPTTGEPCSSAPFPPGCTSAAGYSSTTGAKCDGGAPAPAPVPSPTPTPTPVGPCATAPSAGFGIFSNIPAGFQFTQHMRLGAVGSEVLMLQRFLNDLGFMVAFSGPGSPGQETSKFGFATEAAVRRFQAAYKAEILTPQGLAGPTGFFLSYSLATLNRILAGTIAARMADGTSLGTPCPPRNPALSPVVQPGIFSNIPAGFRFTKDMRLGSKGNEILMLQRFLNDLGFFVAKSGPGSPGMETSTFGPATEKAVKAFQLAYKSEILTPLGLTQPTGFFLSYSRAKINKILSGEISIQH